jgi:4-aminobutyrate aminotransferase-like enzyme
MTASRLHCQPAATPRRGRAVIDACSGGGAFPLGPRHPELVAAAAAQPGPTPEASFAAAQLSMLPLHRRVDMTVHAARSAPEALDAALALCASATGRRDVVVAGPGETPVLDGAGAIVLGPGWFDGAAPPSRVAAARRLRASCRKRHVPLIADETGASGGRSGTWFASAAVGIEPDVIVVSSGLTGLGMPLAAVLYRRSLGAAPASPPAAPGALAAGTRLVELMREGMSADGVLDDVVARGVQISHRLAGLAAHPGVRWVRGGGLTWTVELAGGRARQVQECAARHGVLVDRVGSAVRLLPPLDATADQVETVCSVLLLAVEEAHLAELPWRPSPRRGPTAV